MPLPSAEKDPNARLDYGFDWSTWLGDDTITASEWSSSPADLLLSGAAFGAKTTSTYAAGGDVGTSYVLTNRITTTAGRVDERSIKVKVKER